MRSGANRSRSLAGVMLAVLACGPGGMARAEEVGAPLAPPIEEVRPGRSPFTIGVAATLFFPSAGADLSWQPHDRLALGLQATTLVVHLDLSLRGRLYLAPGGRGGGPYLGANGHLWWSPLVIAGLSPAVTGELGWEWRGPTGRLVGVGLGAGGIHVPRGSGSAGNPEHWELIPLLDLRIAFPI